MGWYAVSVSTGKYSRVADHSKVLNALAFKVKESQQYELLTAGSNGSISGFMTLKTKVLQFFQTSVAI